MMRPSPDCALVAIILFVLGVLLGYGIGQFA